MLSPILDAPVIVQVHIAAAIPSMLLGPLALYRRQRDWVHKLAGRMWVLSMAVLALSSFGIDSFPLPGPFSPIHALSVWVLVDLWRAIRDVRAGRIAQHGLRMRSMYTGAIGIAGLFTLLPGRIMNRVVFGDASQLGLVAIAVGGIALIWVIRRQRQGLGDVLPVRRGLNP